jgi:hemoglobin-like flavoprotein
MALDPKILRESFATVVEQSPRVIGRFYEIFFERYPEVRPMFGRTPAGALRQEKMLTDALVAVLDRIEDAPWLEQTLFALGAKHVDYGVRDEMYEWVCECLLAALAEAAGDAWTPEVEGQWAEALRAIRDMMLEGAEACATFAQASRARSRRSV